MYVWIESTLADKKNAYRYYQTSDYFKYVNDLWGVKMFNITYFLQKVRSRSVVKSQFFAEFDLPVADVIVSVSETF